jgi:6-phosphofructokinase
VSTSSWQTSRTTYDKYGRCVIAASEGIHDKQGTPIISQLTTQVERDAHGNMQLSGTGALADLLCDEIKRNLGIKRVRGDTFGYLQRSFMGCVSDVDQREAREVGEKAVQYAMWGDRDGSVAIKRTGFYSVDYQLVPLETWREKRGSWKTSSSLPAAPTSPTPSGCTCAPAGFRHARRVSPAPQQGRQDTQPK